MLIALVGRQDMMRRGSSAGAWIHTSSTLSIVSPLFTFSTMCASSSVIRCSRVSLSDAEPDVALSTPAASPPIAACGRYFASMLQSACRVQVCIALCTFDCLPARGRQCLAENLGTCYGNLYDDLWRRLRTELSELCLATCICVHTIY